jgi:signal transduction histidine kinase
MTLSNRLLRWLPADSRSGVAQRLRVVWGVALLIAVLQWMYSPQEHRLDRSLVYSYAISTGIWLLCDPLRVWLHRWYGATGPHYWTPSWRTGLHLLLSVVLGYAIGTTIGDAYAGHSTWELLFLSPQRFWSFWFSSMAISVGFVFFFYWRGKSEDLQHQTTEARLQLLQTQLEPHMLFNTLANLRALIASDPPRALDMLDRLNDYLRATFKASRTDTLGGGHTLADEFTRLRDYLELMAVRMGPRLAYTLELPEALAQQPLPPLLLQPLVENAIRHGLEPQVLGGTVSVRVRADGAQHLCIDIRDTGVGMDSSATPVQVLDSGFGLAQVRERVPSLAGGGRIDLHSVPGEGTRISLRLALSTPTSPTP